jgi:hypothetical protein
VVVGYFKQLAFGIIQQVEYIGTVFITVADDFTADAYEFALNKFLENDAAMRLYIGRRHHGIGKPGYVIGTAHHFQFFARFQFLYHGEYINRLVLLLQVLHGPVNALVRIYIKTLGLQYFHHGIEGTFFQHDGTQHRLFQVFRLGGHFAVHHSAEVYGIFGTPAFAVSVFVQICYIHCNCYKKGLTIGLIRFLENNGFSGR